MFIGTRIISILLPCIDGYTHSFGYTRKIVQTEFSVAWGEQGPDEKLGCKNGKIRVGFYAIDCRQLSQSSFNAS